MIPARGLFQTAEVAAAFLATLAAFAVVSFAFGAFAFDARPLGAAAAIAAAVLLAAAVFVVARFEGGTLRSTWTSSGPGGALLRRGIVPLALLPVGLGLVRVRGSAEPTSAELDAVTTTLQLVFLVALAFWSASQLDRLHEARLKHATTASDLRRLAAVQDDSRRILNETSHAFRTPLTSLRIQAALVRSRATTDELCASATVIDRSVGRLDELVSRVLDAAATRRDVETSEVDVRATVDAAWRALGEEARAGHVLEMDVPQGLTAAADVLRLQAVFGELLSNAARFSPAASPIRVHATTMAGKVRVRVEDRGPGVAPGEAASVFLPFVKPAASSREGHPGLGLGLHLAREHAREMGGDVQVEPGPGGRFRVDLPEGR
ncbi:MAG TPA: HAMP domain-containing sensor histidine kinase [Candidatus Thermoplasmatota archaeon]|nr:HAMP domain-containing sensor histidine kinase [Candidatus Thermoplasmatota archaeon]